MWYPLPTGVPSTTQPAPQVQVHGDDVPQMLSALGARALLEAGEGAAEFVGRLGLGAVRGCVRWRVGVSEV